MRENNPARLGTRGQQGAAASSAIPDFRTHAVALWETMQHYAALHSEPQRESEGPPLYSAA